MDFTTSEKRTACLRPGNMRCELAIADASGRKVALQPFDAFAANAATHHQFRFDADGNNLTCVYDEHTASTPYRLTVDDALFSTKSPTITAVGFDNDNSYSILEYNNPDKRLGVDINVAGGLRNLYLQSYPTIWMTTTGLPRPTLPPPTPPPLRHRASLPQGLKGGDKRIARPVGNRGPNARFRKRGCHRAQIILQARDEAGRVALSPMVLTVEIRPVKSH